MNETKLTFETKSHHCAGIFISDKKGSAAVEFALVAVPFLGLITGLIQLFLLFFAQSALENAVRASARQILTGQVQTADATMSASAAAQAFHQIVCNNASLLFTCTGLFVDVEVASNWSSANTGMPPLTYDGNGNVNNIWQFNPGSAGDVVVVRVVYLWPIFFGPLSFNWTNQINGMREIMASAAFQNEPATP